jgi:hypothetical protein
MKVWNDLTLLNKLDDTYRAHGATGAQAVAAVWQEIANGNIELVKEKLKVPEELGLIHAINTWSKHLSVEGKIHSARED